MHLPLTLGLHFKLQQITVTAVFEGLPVYLYARDTRSMSPGIYRYDPEKNCCNELKMPPTKGTCVVTDEQYIYRIGDFSGHLFTLVPLSTTCRFDP